MKYLVILCFLFISCYQVTYVDSKEEIEYYKKNYKVKKVVESKNGRRMFYEITFKNE